MSQLDMTIAQDKTWKGSGAKRRLNEGGAGARKSPRLKKGHSDATDRSTTLTRPFDEVNLDIETVRLSCDKIENTFASETKLESIDWVAANLAFRYLETTKDFDPEVSGRLREVLEKVKIALNVLEDDPHYFLHRTTHLLDRLGAASNKSYKQNRGREKTIPSGMLPEAEKLYTIDHRDRECQQPCIIPTLGNKVQSESWLDLKQLKNVSYQGSEYQSGSYLEIYTNEGPALAKILDIRRTGEGQDLLEVAWLLRRKKTKGLPFTWPKGMQYVLTNEIDIVPLDTVNSQPDDGIEGVEEDRVFDKRCSQLRNCTDAHVNWVFGDRPSPVGGPNSKSLRTVTLSLYDLKGLDAGQLLNDNVITFELQHIEKNMDFKHKQKVHFFDTLFYTALTSKGFNHSAVERWTKNTDIFNVPYLVVPINARNHWFVVIICNLTCFRRKCRTHMGVDGQEDAKSKLPGDDDMSSEYGALPNTSASGAVFAPTEDKVETLTIKDQEDFAISPSARTSNTATLPLPKHDLDAPILISMDSLGRARDPELKHLIQYVAQEGRENPSFDAHKLQNMAAKGLPMQNNSFDCGIYLCGYIAEFAKDPDAFVRRLLRSEADGDEFFGFDPSARRKEIRARIPDPQSELLSTK